MNLRKRLPSKVSATVASLVVVAVLIAFAGVAGPDLFGLAGNGGPSGQSMTLQKAVEDGAVSETRAEEVAAGDITQAQAEILTILDEREGDYDEKSVVLQGVGKDRAQELTALLGASLRITKDGSYARLTLPDGMDIRDVCSAVEYSSYAEEVEPDWHVSLADVTEPEAGEEPDPDEELVGAAGNLARSSTTAFNDPYWDSQGYLDYINPAEELANAATTGEGVLVAVIDTGIDYENPEFEGRISDYSYNASEDKVVKDYDMTLIADERGHGTEVAGVLAAAANNGQGIVGIAPGAQLLVIKANCDAGGKFTNASDLVFGMYYAIERGAKVVNMSFGTDAPSDPFASAVKLAVDSDVIMVAAAGNESTSKKLWPAANPNVIGVGALDSNSYELASYSNYGDDDVMVSAPGTVVTLENGGWKQDRWASTAAGTSVAAPIVSGAIARYASVNSHVEVADIMARLAATSIDLGDAGKDWRYCYGAFDLDAFMNGAEGIVKFDMLTDEIQDETRTFVEGHVLQDVPEPERENAVFDGWYRDDQLEDRIDFTTEALYGEQDDYGVSTITVYAGWTNEDDGVSFTYDAADGADFANGIEVTGYTGKRKYVVVPDTIDGYNVIGIAEHAFYGNNNLVTVQFPSSLTYIEEGAFSSCPRLSSVEIPDAVTRIDDFAFSECVRLQSVAFGERSALSSLGREAFSYCPSLRSFRLGANVSDFNGSVLLGDTYLAALEIDASNASFRLADDGISVLDSSGSTLVYRAAGNSNEYATPEGVTHVASFALAYSRASSIVVSEGVVSLGSYVFMSTSAQSITLPASLQSFGGGCFSHTSNLQEVDMSQTGVSEIPDETFAYCISLTSVLLPEQCSMIGEKAFSHSKLRSIVVPDSVERIDAHAFEYTPIESIVLPAGLETLGERVFTGCCVLQSVTFAEGCVLQVVPAYAFADCPSLPSIELPSQLITVQEHAFEASGLTSISIPASVRTIEQGAFTNCSKLAHVSVDGGNTTYSAQDDVLFDSNATTLVMYPAGRAGSSYEMPQTVQTVMAYAFQGTINLESVTLSSSMVELSSYSFSRCISLRSIELPEGLQTVGANAFEYCISLTDITIPSTVKSIGRYAFFCDYGLESVSFTGLGATSQVSRIGFGAFAYSGLTNVILPSSVSTMGQYAFSGCDALRSFQVDSGSQLDALPAYVFQGCGNLGNITFAQGCSLKRVSAHAFEGLQKLSTVDLSGCTTLSALGNYAFNRDYALTEVLLPECLDEIGRYSFFGCTALPRLDVPQGVSFIGRYAFTSCNVSDGGIILYFGAATLPTQLEDDWNYGIGGYYLGTAGSMTDGDWLYTEAGDGTVVAIKYMGSSATVDASKIAGKDVSAIGYGCFRGNTTLESVTLGNRLATICDYAFAGTTSLGAVEMPASVTYVGAHAFDGSGVASVTFSANSQLERIEDAAFAGTESLTAVQVPASMTKIGRAAFKDSALASLELAEGSQLQVIGKQAFQGTHVTAVSLPDTMREVSDFAFYGVKSLTSLDLGNPTDLKIQSYAFYGCGLTAVTIPAGVTYIGELAFDANTELTSITVDDSNPYYTDTDGVLYDSTRTSLISYPAGLTGKVTIPAGVSSIRFGAFENASVSEVEFEPGSALTTIGYRAFYGCNSLVRVSMPSSVTSIDRYAFAECRNLEQCDLSAATSLTGIYAGAFYGCEKLSGFAIPDTVREIGNKAFYECSLMDGGLDRTSGVITIGDGAFAYSGQTYLRAPSGLLDIGAEAYRGSDLSELDLDNGVLDGIGANAFADCDRFATTNLVVSDSVSYIGSGALSAGKDVMTDLTCPVPTQVDRGNEFTMSYLFGTEPTVLENVVISSAGGFPQLMFYEIHSLKSAVLPDGPIEIPSQMFFGCGNLQSVRLPATTKTIGPMAFSSTDLQTIELPEGLVTIGDSAFDRAPAIVSGKLPSTLERIGAAYLGVAAGTTLEIPAKVSYLSGSAFKGFGDGARLTVAEGNTSYINYGNDMILTADGETLVWVAWDLEGTLVIPDGIKNIYADVSGLTKITGIEFPSSLTPEGGGSISFKYCYALETVSLPASLVGCVDFYSSYVKHVIVQEGATALPNFEGCRYLETVSVPSTVKSIGFAAFRECSNLEEIELPEGLETIEGDAFAGCEKLESLFIPSSVTSIGTGIYSGCTSLQEVTIGSGNTNYTVFEGGLYTADMRTLLCGPQTRENVVIPEGVTTIDYAFSNARMLKSVTIPESITSIGEHAFMRATSLESVHIPDSVTSLGLYAFWGCHSLAEVTGGSNVVKVGWLAFSDTALSHASDATGEPVYVGSVLVYVPAITDLVVKEGTRYTGDNVARYNSTLRSVEFPSTMVSIADLAFQDCTNLEYVTFKEGLEIIGGCAFQNTMIRTLDLPSTLTYIDDLAFARKASNGAQEMSAGPLEYVSFAPGTRARIGWDSFYGQTNVKTVVFSPEMLDASIEHDWYDSVPGKNIDHSTVEGLRVVIRDYANQRVNDISLMASEYDGCYSGADIYCYEDERSTTWHEGWADGNTVHYLGNWDHAVFKVDGHVITSKPLRKGEVLEAPSSNVVKSALLDDCNFQFVGWDVNGDGTPDALPTTLDAVGDLTAEAIYTVHDFDEGVRVEPTCTEKGTLTRTCRVCDKVVVTQLDALGHDWVKGDTVAPTEDEDGYTVYTCSRCGEVENRDWVIATGAEPSDWTLTKAPTCEEEGEESILTPSGHPLQTRAVEAIGHDWDEGTVTVEPTCTEKGIMTFTCKNDAEHKRIEPIEALGHDWGTWTTVVEATYEHSGTRERACSRCDEIESETIPQMEYIGPGGVTLSVETESLVPGQSITLTAANEVADATDPVITWASDNESVATVDQFGKVTAVADGTAWISATNSAGNAARCKVTVQHSHVAGEPVRVNEIAATCTEAGSYEQLIRCQYCGVTMSSDTVEVPALGHAYSDTVVEPTCTQPGHTHHKCSRCGDEFDDTEVPALGHDYETTVVEPTQDEGGYTLHRCSRCGDEYTTDPVDSYSTQADKAAAAAVDALISALPASGSVSLLDAQAVAQARAAYDSLSDAQKAFVGGLGVLEAAEARIGELCGEAGLTASEAEAAAGVAQTVAAIPNAADVSADDAASIEAACEAYSALTEAQKALVPADAVDNLMAASVTTKLVAIPPADELTLDDSAMISTMRAAYDALTEAQKAKVPEAALQALEAAEAKIAELNIPAPTSITGAKVVLNNTSFKYNGTVRKPSVVTVGGMKLVAGTDYDLTYSADSPKAVGTYSVTVIGKGAYTGKATASFKITKASQPMVVKANSKKIKASRVKTKALKLKGLVKVNRSVGTVKYKNASKTTKLKKFKVIAKTGVIIVPKGTKAGTYKVSVKVTAAGNANYLSGSKTVKVKIIVTSTSSKLVAASI